MDQASQTISAQPAIALPPPEITLWSIFWDPVFGVMLVVAVLFALASIWQPAARRFAKKQTDYLDHQRETNEKALAQNKAMEEIIAHQYAQTNARTDKALEQGEAAIRLHAEALEQLKGMNAAIARLSQLMEQERGGRPA